MSPNGGGERAVRDRGVVGDPIGGLAALLDEPVASGSPERGEKIAALVRSLSPAQARVLLANLLDDSEGLGERLKDRVSPAVARLVLRELTARTGHAAADRAVDTRAVRVPARWQLCDNPDVARYPLPEWADAYEFLTPRDRCRLSIFLEKARVAGVEPDVLKAQASRLYVRRGVVRYRMTLRLVTDGGPAYPNLVFPQVDVRDEEGRALELATKPESWPAPDRYGLRTPIQNEHLIDIWIPPRTGFRVTVRLLDRYKRDWRPPLLWPGTGRPDDLAPRLPYPQPPQRYVDQAPVIDFNSSTRRFFLCSVTGIPEGDAVERSEACKRKGGKRISAGYQGFLKPPDPRGEYMFRYVFDKAVGWHVPDVRPSSVPAYNPHTTPQLFAYFWDHLVPAIEEESVRFRLAGAFLEWLPEYVGEGYSVPIGMRRYLRSPVRTHAPAGGARTDEAGEALAREAAGRESGEAAARTGAERGTTGRGAGGRLSGTAAAKAGRGAAATAAGAGERKAAGRLGSTAEPPGRAATAARPEPAVPRRLASRVARRSNSAASILSVLDLEVFWKSKKGAHIVYITPAGQLVGTHSSLKSFVKRYKDKGKRVYALWESHHIIEQKHLENLGIRKHFPAYDDLPCVLLPSPAHRDRVRSFLGKADRQVGLDSATLYSEYYAQAYRIIGAYTGIGTAEQIAAELSKVVKRMLGFI